MTPDRATRPRHAATLLRGVAALVALLVLSTGAAGCGGETRSVESYCKVLAEEKAAYLEKYAGLAEAVESSEDPLAGVLIGLTGTLSAVGDIKIIFDKLAAVAPEEIAPDVEAVRDSFKAQIDALKGAAGDPLGALGAGLVAGLTSAGSWQRVDAWTASHCT